MKIFLASDHAGFEMKEALVAYLAERKLDVEDVGPLTLEPTDDYPDFMFALAAMVAQNKGSLGVGIGGSGQGEAMALNRIKAVRAAVYYGGDKKVLELSRQHNNANVLSLGARFLTVEQAKEALDLWLATSFSNEERHVRRIEKLDH